VRRSRAFFLPCLTQDAFYLKRIFITHGGAIIPMITTIKQENANDARFTDTH